MLGNEVLKNINNSTLFKSLRSKFAFFSFFFLLVTRLFYFGFVVLQYKIASVFFWQLTFLKYGKTLCVFTLSKVVFPLL